MNWAQISRIAWKDYRRIGGLWIAFVAFWGLCLGLIIWSSYQTNRHVAPFNIEQVILSVLVTSVIYAMAWAAITFAAEHEDKTYGFLRSLPLRPKEIFYGKMFFGVNSTILMIATLLLLFLGHHFLLKLNGGAYQWRPQTDGLSTFESLGSYLVACQIPLAMSVGLFWSLRLKRPLLSLVLTAVSVVSLVYLCSGILLAATMTNQHQLGDQLSVSGFLISIFALLFFVVDRLQVSAWLPNFEAGAVPQTRQVVAPHNGTLGEFRRLLWMQNRQLLWPSIALGVLGVAMAFVFSEGRSPETGAIFASMIVGVLGVLVFRGDHEEKRFRLLGQLGVGATSYWLSRLLVPGLAAGVVSVAALESCGNAFGGSSGAHYTQLFIGFTVFSFGQFCSIAFSSTVIAIAVTLFALAFANSWLVLCGYMQTPIWLGHLPPVLLPLLASYLRVSRWFRETGSWKQWLVPLVPLAVLAFGMPVAMAYYRVQEIPAVEMPVELIATTALAPNSAELDADVARCREVFARVPKFALPKSYSAETEASMAVLASANHSLMDDLIEVVDSVPEAKIRLDSVQRAAELLIARGQESQRAVNADAAWIDYRAALELLRQPIDERGATDGVMAKVVLAVKETAVYSLLPVWAMLEGNTPEQIEAAATELEVHGADLRSWSQAFANDYQAAVAIVDDPWARRDFRRDPLAIAAQFAPWELTRTRRLVDHRYAQEFRRLQQVQNGEYNWVVSREYQTEHVDQHWATTTALGSTLALPDYWVNYSQVEHARRGTVYQLAAIAYHKKNGVYPTDFSQVMIGGKPLPDDLGSPSSKMQIGPDQNAYPISGLLIKTAAGQAGYERQLVSAHFVLPDFQDWSPEKFAKRIEDSSPEGRARKHEVWAGFGESPIDMVDRGEGLLELYGEMLSQAIVPSAPFVASAIQDFLSTAADERAELIGRLADERVVLEDFLPWLKTVLRDTDPAVAAAAARVIHSVNERRLLTLEGADNYAELLNDVWSTTESGSRTVERGVPILNHDNGHYYELVKFEGGRSDFDWRDGFDLAASKRFKGMKGHLVTITSKAENDFLCEAFSTHEVMAAWIGASDADEKGVWKWNCGPEDGNVFWGQVGDGDAVAGIGFSNWLNGKPTQASILEVVYRQFFGGMSIDEEATAQPSCALWWAVPTDHESEEGWGDAVEPRPGQWLVAPLDAPHGGVLGCLVEYSPNADDAEVEPVEVEPAEIEPERGTRPEGEESADQEPLDQASDTESTDDVDSTPVAEPTFDADSTSESD